MKRSVAIGVGAAVIVGACVYEVPSEEEAEQLEVESQLEAIIGGTRVLGSDWGGAGAVMWPSASGGAYAACGATLIAPRWALTAAHCVDDPSDQPTSIVFGRNDLTGTGGQSAAIAKTILHPGYVRNTLANDIALVQLTDHVTKTPVRFVSASEAAQVAVGDIAVGVGWGAQSQMGEGHSRQKFQVGLPVSSAGGCTATQICAGGDLNKDTCVGDSGGPLYDRVGTGYFLAGITSTTSAPDHCGLRNFPGQYTRVSSYVDFINNHARDKHTLWSWNTNRTTVTSSVLRESAHVALAGDFDNDGRDDVYYYQPGSGADTLYRASGVQTSWPATADYQPFVGDFDNNGFDDVFWYGPGAATDKIWWVGANATVTEASVTVSGTYTPVVGDYDGNGTDDVFWYGKGTAADYIWWFTTGRSFTQTTATQNGVFTPIAGNFDGDARADIFWYAPGAAQDMVWFGSAPRGAFIVQNETVTTSYTPVAGDFDGNGTTDIYWWRPGPNSDSMWWWAANRTHTPQAKSMGERVGSAVVGKFDAGATDDILWYRGGRGSAETATCFLNPSAPGCT